MTFMLLLQIGVKSVKKEEVSSLKEEVSSLCINDKCSLESSKVEQQRGIIYKQNTYIDLMTLKCQSTG